MKQIFLLSVFLLVLFSKITFASPQAPDVIIYNNKVLDLFALPLEDYYKNKNDKPKFFISPQAGKSRYGRGYIAIWEITENKLFLRGLDSWICSSVTEADKPNCHRADLKELFGEKAVKGKVPASWFTGELRISDGELSGYFDETSAWFGQSYEREIIMKVKAGKITNQIIVDNSKQEHR